MGYSHNHPVTQHANDINVKEYAVTTIRGLSVVKTDLINDESGLTKQIQKAKGKTEELKKTYASKSSVIASAKTSCRKQSIMDFDIVSYKTNSGYSAFIYYIEPAQEEQDNSSKAYYDTKLSPTMPAKPVIVMNESKVQSKQETISSYDTKLSPTMPAKPAIIMDKPKTQAAITLNTSIQTKEETIMTNQAETKATQETITMTKAELSALIEETVLATLKAQGNAKTETSVSQPPSEELLQDIADMERTVDIAMKREKEAESLAAFYKVNAETAATKADILAQEVKQLRAQGTTPLNARKLQQVTEEKKVSEQKIAELAIEHAKLKKQYTKLQEWLKKTRFISKETVLAYQKAANQKDTKLMGLLSNPVALSLNHLGRDLTEQQAVGLYKDTQELTAKALHANITSL